MVGLQYLIRLTYIPILWNASGKCRVTIGATYQKNALSIIRVRISDVLVIVAANLQIKSKWIAPLWEGLVNQNDHNHHYSND